MERIYTNINVRTIQKHRKINEEYTKMRQENKEKYKEAAKYITRTYYYEELAKKFHLTPNYICTIIKKYNENETKYNKIIRDNEYDN